MSLRDLRTMLADHIRTVVPDEVTVYRSAVDGPPSFPAVVLGMPSWRPLNGCLSTWEFPVAVIVGRNGVGGDTPVVDQLEDVWPDVLGALVELRDRGDVDDVTKADFGLFNVQGIDYPAQVLTCTMTTTAS